MIIIGIDPGKKTGISRYQDGELKDLVTYSPDMAIHYILNAGVDMVVFEDSRLQSPVFVRTAKNGKLLSPASQLKIARDVGTIDAQCRELVAKCEENKIKIIGLSPRQKGAKLNHAQFVLKTGWQKSKSNQHTRDAATVAWPFRYGEK
jgi:predicted RNase H-like nuclease (RuvC/YqgF family)